MTGALVFTLLVAAGEGDSPATRAMVQALSESLGAGLETRVREVEAPLSDEAALRVEGAAEAGALAVLSWSEPSRRVARVRVHLREGGRWLERSIEFAAGDDPGERGRTIGFTLASMLPVRDRSAANTAAAPPAGRSVAVGLPAAPAPDQPARYALDALVFGSLGVSGDADGVGGAFAVRRAVHSKLAVRFELSGRTGIVQAAEATSLSLHGTLGLCLSPFGNPAARRADLSLRAALGVFYESLGHLSSDDRERVRQSRFVPGGDLVLEASFRALGSASLVLGAGSELAFGRTDVYVHGQRVAVLPALRFVASLGLRQYF